MTEHEHDVPPQPAFVLRVQNDAGGAPTAWLDDEQLTVPPGVGVHRALIRAARRRADRTQPGSTIRVVGMTETGDSFHLAIGPDGEAWEVPPPPSVETGHAPPPPETAAPSPEPETAPAQPTPEDVVPNDISHVIQLREEDDRLIGLVDDDEITLVRGDDPYEQLLREARARADRHSRGRTVRVLGRTPDGRVWHIALTPDGEPRMVGPVETPATSKIPPAHPAAPSEPVNAFRPADEAPDEPEPQPAYIDDSSPNEPQRAGDPSADSLTDDFGRPIPTTTTTTTTQASAQRDLEETAEPEPEPVDEPASAQQDDSGPSRRALLLGGAGAVVLLGAAAGGFFAFRGNGQPAASTPSVTGTPLPDGIRSPAGLPSSYLWSVVKLSDVSPQLAITDKLLVCTVDNDTTGGTQLLAVDSYTGKTRWKADLPVEAVVSHGPALVPVDGKDSILVGTQDQLMAYPLSGGDPKTWPVEAKWSVGLTRSGVIITKPDDKKSAYILHGDKLARRALPKGANPVAVRSDGTLVATDSRGSVWLVKDAKKAPKAKKLKAPKGTTPGTYVAATGDQIISAFVPKDDPKTSQLRSFSLPKLQPRITTDAIDPAVFPNNFMLAPDESWAVAGNAWIDMSTGESHVITAKWSPIAISQHNSWSMSGDNVLTASDKGKSLGAAKGSGGQVTVPRGGTDRVAYCVASIGSETTLYAMPLKD